MEPISLAVGAGILAVGIVLGKVLSGRRPPQHTPSGAVCDCEHSLAYHDPKEGVCHAIYQLAKYDDEGDWVGHRDVSCECRRYTGPKVLDPGFIAQEIIGG